MQLSVRSHKIHPCLVLEDGESPPAQGRGAPSPQSGASNHRTATGWARRALSSFKLLFKRSEEERESVMIKEVLCCAGRGAELMM